MAGESFEAVKNLTYRFGWSPPMKELRKIEWALRDIHERLMRVRCISPTTDLTDRMWRLMKRVGLSVQPVRKVAR